MRREDAMRLLGELDEMQGRIEGLCDSLVALLTDTDT
jgi:hypothetical protein